MSNELNILKRKQNRENVSLNSTQKESKNILKLCEYSAKNNIVNRSD